MEDHDSKNTVAQAWTSVRNFSGVIVQEDNSQLSIIEEQIKKALKDIEELYFKWSQFEHF